MTPARHSAFPTQVPWNSGEVEPLNSQALHLVERV